MYKIKEFEWVGDDPKKEFDSIHANTPFGSYYIRIMGDGFSWDYCFDEYYDENQYGCDSIEDGKKKAFEHWTKRILPILVKIKK